jgi:hypothetical protein
MSDAEKLQGWFNQVGEEGIQAAARWLRAVDMLAAGTYEPKNALSDWYFFMSRWLAFLPEAPVTTGQALPLVLLTVHAGQDSAAGARRIRRANAAAFAGDFVNTKDSAKSIARADLTAALHDGGTTLLVTASRLAAKALSVGDTYAGKVMDGATAIANVEIRVLGALA